MGTNYYAVVNKCEHCGRHDRIHIGKHSGGWQFTFHGHDGIRSWQDWKMKLAEPGIGIENEYGDAFTLSDFMLIVDASRGRKDHIKWCTTADDSPSYTREAARRDVESGHDWHDPDGFSFTSHDFS